MTLRTTRSPVWFAGALLLACFLPAVQPQMTDIPNIAPYPTLQPTDASYPGNIPTNLPTTLDSAPAVLTQGPLNGCATTVGQVLAANQRTMLAQYLQQTTVGQQILSGQMSATILAPPDAYFKQVLASGYSGSSGTQAASALAAYHVLQGTITMDDMGHSSGLYWNSTMGKAACPAACQVVTTQASPVDVDNNGQVTFVRSATQTARITTGDIKACNSVVHLLDRALQPCCTSMFEMLGNFSIVQIQPSYFNNYAPQEPLQSVDRFNRRLFEEAAVDLLLYATSRNMSRTILWPSPQAWGGLSLADLLPGIGTLDVPLRTQAMKILALYAMSYTPSLLPKDIPAADGSAPAVQFPYASALLNTTAPDNIWTCADTLTVSTPALSATGTPTTSTAVTQGQPQVQAGRRKRSLLAAAAGSSKTINVQAVYETCERARILIVDAVPVPCNFVDLVRNYGSIEQRLAAPYVPKQFTDLESAYYDWLLSKGIIQPDTPVSSYKSAAHGMGMTWVQQQVVLLLAVLLSGCFMLS